MIPSTKWHMATNYKVTTCTTQWLLISLVFDLFSPHLRMGKMNRDLVCPVLIIGWLLGLGRTIALGVGIFNNIFIYLKGPGQSTKGGAIYSYGVICEHYAICC